MLVDSDGNAEMVQQGSPRRLKTIYRTNVNTAYSVGRYIRQAENVDSRPYWVYVAVMDARTRASHAAMNGQVFPYDDAIWATHYPPNGFNCRCRVRALTQRQVDTRNITVHSSDGRLQRVMQDVGVDKRTGELIQRPAWRYTAPDGKTMTPSPGWNYNPGRAGYQPNLDRYDFDLARDYVAGSLRGPAFARAWHEWEARVLALRRENPGLDDDALLSAVRQQHNPRFRWPVAIIGPEDRQLLDTTTQVVLLSDWTLGKQAVSRAGQAFGLEDYWRVQPTIEEALTVLRSEKPSGREVFLFYGRAGRIYVAVLKPTRNQTTGADELYLESFRRSSERELARLRRRYEVVR